MSRVVHEVSFAQGILDIVKQHVPLEQAAAIRKIQVKVGHLSGVVPESLEFSFAAIVADTPWHAAQLDIQRIATVACCNECSTHFEVRELVFRCAQCGGASIRLISGSDLTVVAIEVDEEKPKRL